MDAELRAALDATHHAVTDFDECHNAMADVNSAGSRCADATEWNQRDQSLRTDTNEKPSADPVEPEAA